MNLILYLLLVLIILSCFGQYFNKYNCAITSLLIIFVLVYLMTHDLEKSLLIAASMTILLSFIKCPLRLESFENGDNNDNNDNNDKGDKDEKDEKDEKFRPKYNIATGKTVELKPHIPRSLDMNIPADRMTPAQAQRASHDLIKSVEHLKNTMEELVPNLSAAKKVIDMYKTIKP